MIGDLYKTRCSICATGSTARRAPCRRDLGLPAEGELVGRAIRRKPPSAELRPDQKDSDSLPDYSALDPLLKGLIQERIPPENLVAAGHSRDLVERIQQLLRRAEFKPPGGTAAQGESPGLRQWLEVADRSGLKPD